MQEIYEYSVDENEIVESESHSIGRSQMIGSLQVEKEYKIESIESNEESEFFTAIEAQNMNSETLDMRPYLFDGLSKQNLLLDSGAQVSAYPPDPGDVPDPTVHLKAVNGTRLRSYGKKEVEVKIGRKTYNTVCFLDRWPQTKCRVTFDTSF